MVALLRVNRLNQAYPLTSVIDLRAQLNSMKSSIEDMYELFK